MQKRSLYAAIMAAVVGIAGAILAVSRRRSAPIAETQSKAFAPEAVTTSIVQQSTDSVLHESPVARESVLNPIVNLVAAGLGITCLVVTQVLLLHSRNPVLPAILFVAGVLLLQPMLALHAQMQPAKTALTGIRSQVVFVILTFSVVSLLLNIFSPGRFQMLSAALSALVIPAVYMMGKAYGDPLVGLIAAGFTAVSGWTLALGKAEPGYIVLAVVSALALAALEYIRRRQGSIFYTIWLVFFIGGVVILTLLMSTSAQPDPSRQAQIPANPQLALGEGLFTSLLMFNLTTDPNPLHGIVDRPVFSPILAALFVVGLLTLAWRINSDRRWVDIFLLSALAITLLPSAFQPDLPVLYPDIQRGAMALPVAMVIAAVGAASLAKTLAESLSRNGILIAAVLLAGALVITAVDANQHYANVFLPIYELSTHR